MLSTRRRSLTAIAAGAVVLTALAGCGSDDKKDAAPKAASTSSSSPSETPTETPTESTESADAGPVAGPGERLTKDNLVPTMLAAMREKKTAHMAMEFGSSVSADADVRYGGGATDMKMSMSLGAQKLAAIVIDGTLYLQQGEGAKFVKVDENTPGVGEILAQISGLGPDGAIAAWKNAVKDVQYVGTDSVDGTKVDEYRVSLDSAALGTTIAGLGGSAQLPKTVTYDLFVDRDHLMRRLDVTLSGQHIKVIMTNWGKPVDIEPPPASQIMSQ